MSQHEVFFLDRVLTVYLSLEGERGRGMVLDSCALRQVGERIFLIGTCVESQWFAGAEVALPWDRVETVVSMTREQFERARHEKKR
jgi:hypothetical protein